MVIDEQLQGLMKLCKDDEEGQKLKEHILLRLKKRADLKKHIKEFKGVDFKIPNRKEEVKWGVQFLQRYNFVLGPFFASVFFLS